MKTALKWFAISGLVWLTVVATAMTCDTPVYRYAMYRWFPTPYEVYHFYRGEPGEDANRIATQIENASDSKGHQANLIYFGVDLASDPELNSIPPDIKQAWSAAETQELPSYLVSTPFGQVFFQGNIDEESAKSLIDSPARTSIGKELETGSMGLFLMLEGTDREANQKAESVVQQLCEQVRSGEIGLYQTDASNAVENSAAEDERKGEEEQKNFPELGLIRVRVEEAEKAESWFVRSLETLLPSPRDLTQPALFLIFGRGRALPAFVGGTIEHDNLLSAVEFISGQCSCTVKDQNPGMDLLIRYDWEQAAVTLADKFGAEEGNESRFGGDTFFPELIIPPTTTQVATAEADSVEDQSAEAGSADDAGQLSDIASKEPDAADPALAQQTVANTESADSDRGQQSVDQNDPTESIETASTGSLPATAPEKAPLATSPLASLLIVGGGLAVALVVLFGITFIVMKPQ